MTASVWKSLQLVPDDVLFFRDGKPSTLGQDHYLKSLFPPYPSTVYGALRTRRLTDEVDLSNMKEERQWKELPAPLRGELGEWGGFGTLAMRGPWLVRNQQILLPAPHDLGLVMKPLNGAGNAGHERDRIARVVRFGCADEPVAGSGKAWSHTLALLRSEMPGDTEPESPVGWYIDAAGMETWLDGGTPQAECFVRSNELWKDEARTGVGLEVGKRIHKEHNLYTLGFLRLAARVGIGFEIRGQGGDFQAGGHIRLGGEGRTGRLEPGPPFASADRRLTKRFTIYFGTPTLSRGGAYPPGFAGDRLEGSLGGVRCRLAGAAVRGSALVGGWDIATSRAKALRRAIPSGAVFHFEASGDSAPGSVHGSNLADFTDQHLAQQGFGLVLSGIAG